MINAKVIFPVGDNLRCFIKEEGFMEFVGCIHHTENYAI